MILDTDTYIKLEFDLLSQLAALKSKIEKDDIQYIKRYIEHAEIEIAFEILGLTLMQQKVSLKPDIICALVILGKQLGLDNESMFDPEFWVNFMNYLNQSNCDMVSQAP